MSTTEQVSLRDYFAGQALVGILGSRVGFLVDCGIQNVPGMAYEVADGMMAARQAGQAVRPADQDDYEQMRRWRERLKQEEPTLPGEFYKCMPRHTVRWVFQQHAVVGSSMGDRAAWVPVFYALKMRRVRSIGKVKTAAMLKWGESVGLYNPEVKP